MSRLMSFSKHFFLMIFIFFVTPTVSMAATTIENYQNKAVKEIRPTLDEFVHKAFREYPYLYVFQKENDYNAIFENDPDAFILFAKRDGKLIGTLQASPLSSPYLEKTHYTPSKSLDQIRKRGFNPEKILYITSFLMSKEERTNLPAIKLLFDKAVENAKGMGKSQICFMEVVENKNHPLRPDPYVPLEPWKELGRNIKNMNVVTQMSWPTLQPDGKVKDEKHKMMFFVMDISESKHKESSVN